MHSSKQKPADTAPRVRASLTLAGLFVIGLLSSLGLVTGSHTSAVPAVDGVQQGRWVHALEPRLLAAPEKQKPADWSGSGYSPGPAAHGQAHSAPESRILLPSGKISSAPAPRWLLVSAPPRAPPARA